MLFLHIELKNMFHRAWDFLALGSLLLISSLVFKAALEVANSQIW
jgi:hypothetical protein